MAKHGYPEGDAADDATAWDPPIVQPLLVRAGVEKHIEALRAWMAVMNLAAGVACLVDKAGASPAFLFLATIAPLPLWGLGFTAVASGLVATAFGMNTRSLEHALAFVLWGTTATGGTIGLLTGTTTSPTASLVLTALIVGMAGHHVLALFLRRRMARLSS